MHKIVPLPNNREEVTIMNKPLKTALFSIGLAQSLKVPLKRLKTGQWDLGAILETGGMPSSHSAGVASLATYIAKQRGVKTIDFALAAIFGMIVMYDAQGVRRQAGEIAIKLNDLEEEMEHLAGMKERHYHDRKEKRLKEALGHQPIEVIGGALLGIAIGLIAYNVLEK